MVETMERQVLGRISASNGCTTIRPPWRCYGLLDENLTLITYRPAAGKERTPPAEGVYAA
jgi:hypothetical protein